MAGVFFRPNDTTCCRNSRVAKQCIHCRSAPKGRQQMGETGFCKNLRFSAVSCENLRFPAVFCANLRLPNPLICRASRKSTKICKNLRKCAFRVRVFFVAVSLLARPDIGSFWWCSACNQQFRWSTLSPRPSSDVSVNLILVINRPSTDNPSGISL